MNLETANVATVIVAFFALIGGAVVIFNPSTLSFEQYLDLMAEPVGLLAIGRGLASAGKAGALNRR